MLPDELWERVLHHLRDPLDAFAVGQVAPRRAWASLTMDPTRTLPAAWFAREEIDRAACMLVSCGGMMGTHHSWSCNDPTEACWTSLYCPVLPHQLEAALGARLRALDLEDDEAELTADTLRRIAEACPRLQALRIRTMLLTANAMTGFASSFAHLHTLRLECCLIRGHDGTLRNALSQLPCLADLNLSYNPLSWPDLHAALPPKNRLTALHINGLGSAGVDAATTEALLTRCPHVRSLSADYTHWTEDDAWQHVVRREWYELSVRGNSWNAPPRPARIRAARVWLCYLRSDAFATLLPDAHWKELTMNYSHPPPCWLVRLPEDAPALQRMSCLGCTGILADALCTALLGLPTLRTLQLDYTFVDRVPAHRGIERLSLVGCPLRLDRLALLPRLRRVVLGNVSAEAVETLATWIRADPWFRHAWFRTQAQCDQLLRRFPELEGSVHLQSVSRSYT